MEVPYLDTVVSDNNLIEPVFHRIQIDILGQLSIITVDQAGEVIVQEIEKATIVNAVQSFSINQSKVCFRLFR